MALCRPKLVNFDINKCIARGGLWNKYIYSLYVLRINLLRPTGHVMHQQFNIQQLYALPTLYLCVLYLYEKKQRLVSFTA